MSNIDSAYSAFHVVKHNMSSTSINNWVLRYGLERPNLGSFGWVSYDKVGVSYLGKLGAIVRKKLSGALVESNKATSLRRKRKGVISEDLLN